MIFKFKFKEKFDCVLIDAPCSGSGLIQKNLKCWYKKIFLPNKQTKKNVIKSNKFCKGGYIIYCVCSILKAEGENKSFLF